MQMMTDMIYARQYAKSRKSWVVVIVPPEQHDGALTIFAGALADGDPFGGRTISFQDGGKMSLASVTDAVFVPSEMVFDAMFVGWGGKASSAQEMSRWRTAARQTVTRAA